MQPERTTWNDDRLDDLAAELRSLGKLIDNRFDRVDDRFEYQSATIEKRFDSQSATIENRFDSQSATIEKRFDNLTYGLIGSLAGLLAAFGGALVAIQA